MAASPRNDQRYILLACTPTDACRANRGEVLARLAPLGDVFVAVPTNIKQLTFAVDTQRTYPGTHSKNALIKEDVLLEMSAPDYLDAAGKVRTDSRISRLFKELLNSPVSYKRVAAIVLEPDFAAEEQIALLEEKQAQAVDDIWDVKEQLQDRTAELAGAEAKVETAVNALKKMEIKSTKAQVASALANQQLELEVQKKQAMIERMLDAHVTERMQYKREISTKERTHAQELARRDLELRQRDRTIHRLQTNNTDELVQTLRAKVEELTRQLGVVAGSSSSAANAASLKVAAATE